MATRVGCVYNYHRTLEFSGWFWIVFVGFPLGFTMISYRTIVKLKGKQKENIKKQSTPYKTNGKNKKKKV